MDKIDPRYFEAKKRLNALAQKHPKMQNPAMTQAIGYKWDACLEKDPTGVQCFRWVEELEELLGG